MHRVLSPADYVRMPWKNGGGSTTELACYPEGADLDAFVWRASIADVERDGPFSVFAGVERTLVLLAGNGISLTNSFGEIVLRAPFASFSFGGEAKLECRLLDGPTRDFNLMVRRRQAHGSVRCVRRQAAAVAPARFALCYAARGVSEYRLRGRAPIRLAEGGTLLVDAREPSGALRVHPLEPDAAALVATIDLV